MAQCVDLRDLGFNDIVSSLKVDRTGSFGSANGYWRSITTTEEIDFTIHYGYQSTESEEVSTSEEFTLSYEMTSGINFGYGHESETISESYSKRI